MIAEVDGKALAPAIEAGVKARNNEFVSAKDLVKDIKWLNKALGDYEVGSRIGLKAGPPDRFVLDDSEATRPNRAEGLTDGDTIAVGPTISPRALMNARGRVVAIEGDTVYVELDPGDRDRYRRATGKQVAEQATFPLVCVEKID